MSLGKNKKKIKNTIDSHTKQERSPNSMKKMITMKIKMKTLRKKQPQLHLKVKMPLIVQKPLQQLQLLQLLLKEALEGKDITMVETMKKNQKLKQKLKQKQKQRMTVLYRGNIEDMVVKNKNYFYLI